jgi:hypothetical protein
MSTLIEVMMLVFKLESKDDDEALLFVSSVKVLLFFYESNNISRLITMSDLYGWRASVRDYQQS